MNCVLEKLNLNTELLELKSSGILKDILTDDYEVSIDLFDVDISEEEVSKTLNIDQQFALPILDGNISLNKELINYSFSQNNTYKSSAKITGTGLLKENEIYKLVEYVKSRKFDLKKFSLFFLMFP